MPQSYYLTKNHQNNEILVASFNSFVGDINNIVGIGVDSSGYGQSHLVVATASEQVTTPGWDALLTAMKFAGKHQGTILYSPTSTSDASWPTDDILSIIPTITTDIANIVGNKLNSDVSYMTVTPNVRSSNNTYVDPAGNPGTPYWTSANQIYYEAKVQFADSDARRHFFNTGGEVRFDSTLTGIDVSHNQSVDWKTMLTDISVVKLKHSITEASTGVGTEGVGFSSLTTTYQVIYTKGGTGDYSGNQLNIHAKLSGTADIDIKIAFDDRHESNITGGNFVVGTEYTIVQAGTTDFTLIGASDNNKATIFTATGPGTGTGIASYTTGTWTNSPYSGTWTGMDYVAGVLTVTFDELITEDEPGGVTLTSPSYSHISQL